MQKRRVSGPASGTGPRATVEGIIQLTRKGVGYLPWPLDPARGKEKEDIEIDPQALNGALNGDEVEVEVLGVRLPRAKSRGGILKSPMRPHGAVKRVISRAKEEFVGTLRKNGAAWTLVPDDPKFYRPMLLKDAGGAAEGDKILARLRSFTGEQDPQGEVLQVLGRAGEHRTEMNAIVLERGFSTTFPAEVAREAKEIEEKHADTIAAEAKNRADYRGTTTFTIDPLTAKDFDDAISVRELEGGEYEIGVHIADVSFFVREGTALEEEARKRGTSVYLVDATIPMLPEELSGNVCSLKEGEDRLVFSAVFRMNDKAEVLERRFERAIIRSDKRFVYEEAQKILDSSATISQSETEADKQPGLYLRELTILRDLARVMRKEREQEGAIDFGDNEVKFTLDEQGRPTAVERKMRIETNLLIEEFMLLANRETAKHVAKLAEKVPEKNLVFLYRIHDQPKADRIEELATFVRAVGYEFGHPKKKQYSARDIQKLLKDIEGTPEEQLIRTATLRSMAKAIYSTKNIGHFGLAFQYYTHFTSPIRRYPDVLVHRILASHLPATILHGKTQAGEAGAPLTRREFEHLEKLCIAASEQEAKAADAERASIRYKQVEYMAGKIGQEFDGVISGVTDWGIYVEEKESAAEGLVRMSAMGDDFYNFDSKSYSVVGQRTKKKRTLGDKVRVKLVGADLAARTLDFVLV